MDDYHFEFSNFLVFRNGHMAREYKQYQRKQIFLPTFYFSILFYIIVFFVRGSVLKATVFSLGPYFAIAAYVGTY